MKELKNNYYLLPASTVSADPRVQNQDPDTLLSSEVVFFFSSFLPSPELSENEIRLQNHVSEEALKSSPRMTPRVRFQALN